MKDMQSNVTEQLDAHAVAFLRLATTFLIFGSVAFAVVLLIGAPEQRLRLIGPAVIALVAATAKYCHSRGRNRAAIQVLVFGIWGEVAGTSMIAGGMHAPAVFLYLPIIFLAGWLLGTRIAYAVALLSVAVTLGLALAESRQAFPLPHSPPGLMLIIQVGVFLFSAIMIGRIVSSYQTRLKEVETLGSELDERVRALAASEASYRGLFDSVNEAIYIHDRQGRFLDINDGAVRMYGHPRERFIGQTPEFVSAPGMNDLAAVGARMERAFAGEPQRFEFWGLRANGEIFPKNVRLVRSVWFGQEVVIAMAEDITEQEQARAEIKQLNAGLEQRVQARTAELTAANHELESFAYSISHDLRAPLRGIDGFSHLLAEEYGDKLDDQGRGYLERVRRAAQRMGSLIDDILEMSRVTRQEMRRVSVDLSQIAAELFEEHSRVRPEPRVEIRLAIDCKAHGDPQLLRVVMQNLMENALKYSGKKASPKIEFGREWSDGKQVYFMRDNGVGFDMKYADRLFVPFQRLHKPEEFAGNGVGLATVARIVRRHGGRVWAESTPDVHTTIRFTLS